MISFYEENGLWLFVAENGSKQYYPAGSCRMLTTDERITMLRISEVTAFINGAAVSEIGKNSIGETYTDVAEFVAATKAFFTVGGGIQDVSIVDENGTPAKVDDDGQLHIVGNSKLCEGNSTDVPVLAGEVWTGTPQNILAYNGIAVFVTSDVLGFLEVQFSKDGLTKWETSETYVINAGDKKWFTPPTFGIYFRLKYSNNTTDQTVFDIITKLSKFPFKWSSHNIEEPISGGDDAELTKAVITAKKDNGNYDNLRLSNLGNAKVALAEYQGDAFGRLRVSEPFTIFDNSQIYEASNALFWSELLNGTGLRTADITNACQLLSVGANNGDYIVYQTKQRFKYQPGKSHEVLITGLFNTEIDVIKRVGLLDVDNRGLVTISSAPQNGVYFENNNGVLSFNIAKNGVVTESVTQENWNVDTLDGAGNSGFTFDIDGTNIFFMDMEWLGVGAVRCGFVSNTGEILIAHQFRHASNGFVDVYMRTPNLPIHYSIISSGGSGTLKAICSSVISEGGYNSSGVIKSIPPSLTTTTYAIAAGTVELVCGFRLKRDSYDASVIPLSFDAFNTESQDCKFSLCYNPTYSGAVTWIDLPDSNIQYAVNNNNQVTAKSIELSLQFLPSLNKATSSAGEKVDSSLRVGRDLQGNLDEIWLICEAIGNSDVAGAITLRDII